MPVNTRLRILPGVLGLSLLLAGPGPVLAADEEAERVAESIVVLEELMGTDDAAIPQAILERAVGIAIFPGTIKAGFIFGGQRGRGVLAAKHEATGAWSSPAFLTLTGGSFGLQIGGQSVDLVLVIQNQRGLENLLRNEFKIGGEASAVVGPLGRNAEASTDIQLRAEILSYSRTRGVFAGISLQGSTIRADRDANQRFYGERLESGEIVLEGRAPSDAPDVVGRLQNALAAVDGQ